MFYCTIKVFLTRVCIYSWSYSRRKNKSKKEHSPHTRDDRYKRYVDDFPMTSDIKKKNDNDLLTVFFLDRGMRAFSKN